MTYNLIIVLGYKGIKQPSTTTPKYEIKLKKDCGYGTYNLQK